MSTLYIQAAVVFTLPLIVAAMSSAIMWRSLGKPWLFFVVLVVVFYTLYVCIIYFTPPSTKTFLSATTNEKSVPAPQFYFLSEYIKQMVIFTVLSVPFAWAVSLLFRNNA